MIVLLFLVLFFSTNMAMDFADQYGEREDTAPNTLTKKEKREGFELLFDGKTTRGWRGWKRATVPKAWEVRDGALSLVPGDDGGDICTSEEFDNFELRLEWKIEPGGNSGIFYRASEDYRWAAETGPEFQILDDERHPNGKTPETSAGAVYALYAPSKKVARPAGEWNVIRIIAKGNHVEHWMNNVKITEYVMGSEDWNSRVAKSKFASFPEFGKRAKGRIVFQDHGYKVWFRNIRIKRL